MYLRKTTRRYKDKTYTNHLLVESVHTVRGPRQRIICSLGSLEPAPAEAWLGVAHKLEAALQGQESLPGSAAAIADLTEQARRRTRPARATIELDVDHVAMEESREAGPVHVGHQVWQQLRIDPILRRTALSDVLHTDFAALDDEALYRNLDRLHPKREAIERELAEQEKTLFTLDDTVYLYDLTSTYFEGQARRNPQTKRGYSRDQRPDCKQVIIGLVLDRDGFSKA